MTAEPTPATPGSPAPWKLQHWIYGSVPEIGYSVRARSADLNLSFYARPLEGIYTPIAGENLHGDDVVVDVVMAHPTSGGNELLYSLIRPGPPDAEYQRRTFLNHTVVLPVAALRSGALTFDGVESAMRSFDPAHAGASGVVEPLAVPRIEDPTARTPPGRGIDRYLSRASAETLLTRSLQEPEGRTLVMARETTPVVRHQTLVKMLEVLSIACSLPFVSSLSDTPGGPVADRFQLVIAARAFRTDGSWALLDNALDAPSLPRAKGQAAAYDALAACYSDALGAG
ncbi:MAG: hypothetical protein L3K08_06650 [Thermoplasmata archaeon]|nr:hypothetical protein [Thermoplasmata archaeon]